MQGQSHFVEPLYQAGNVARLTPRYLDAGVLIGETPGPGFLRLHPQKVIKVDQN